ncbi:hypothetical protein [Flectobacillus major]|jgi:hypothetical protein|uniref:hypothetical protein n=1 Tax=Flectobacillus major TaxID=103 RepID=UPI0004068FD2|nr:hypothetical protein [Flectobacillus major]
MEDSRDFLLAIRPNLPQVLPTESVLEQFQNTTLRPILKLQNDLLVAIFRQYIVVRKGQFYALSEKEQIQYIEQVVKKDMKFKHYLEGIISAYFTLDEYQIFLSHEEELTKRLINMLIQRLQSQLLLLTK